MPEEYFHQDYPKMLYHEDGRPPAIVDDAEEEQALKRESGWHDSPAAYGVETCPAAPAGQRSGYVMQGYKKPERVNPQPAPAGATPGASATSSPEPSGPGRRRE